MARPRWHAPPEGPGRGPYPVQGYGPRSAAGWRPSARTARWARHDAAPVYPTVPDEVVLAGVTHVERHANNPQALPLGRCQHVATWQFDARQGLGRIHHAPAAIHNRRRNQRHGHPQSPRRRTGNAATATDERLPRTSAPRGSRRSGG